MRLGKVHCRGQGLVPMLIEFLCRGAWAMKHLAQTGLFLSEKDLVLLSPMSFLHSIDK